MDPNFARRFSSNGLGLYETLELNQGANADEIKKQYRRLALRYHPDKNPNDLEATEKFKDVNKAHKILSDPNKKEIYDKHGSLGLHIAENFGEENVKYYFMLSSWWCKALCGVCCILTGCYFCCCCLCCCNCCCGKCAPKVEEEDIPDAEDLAAEEEADSQPTTTQPRSTGGSPAKSTNGDHTAIPLGPPSGSPPLTTQPIGLGPPPPYSTSPIPLPPSEKTELNSSNNTPTKHYNSTSNSNNW